jgi:hypothetical protein
MPKGSFKRKHPLLALASFMLDYLPWAPNQTRADINYRGVKLVQ